MIVRSLLCCAFVLLQPRIGSALSPDDVINNTLVLGSPEEAGVHLQEGITLINALVNDPNGADGLAVNFTQTTTRIMHMRGGTIATLAMWLPLVPGEVSDPASIRGKLAAYLKREAQTFLLDSAYWEWEHAATSGGAYLSAANPRVSIGWNHRWRGGPHWEKLHGLWAYAYHSGDWALVQNNWSFIKARYGEGYAGTDNAQRSAMTGAAVAVYRSGINDLANGAISYTRLAEKMQDSSAGAARALAAAALDAVLDRVDVSWASCPAFVGWDNTPIRLKGEWTPGYNLTPELGRWINDRRFSTASSRLAEAVNAGELRGHWWAGFLNNYWKSDDYTFAGEDRLGTESLSHQLYLGKAWMLFESSSDLAAVKPWHTTMGSTPEYRDLLYLRSLYALVTRYSTNRWERAW